MRDHSSQRSSRKTPPLPAPPVPPSRPGRVRVLVVDDHPILVEGLTASINSQHDLEVCGSAASASEALQAVAKLKPGLVVADISLHDSHGIELTKDIVAQHPGVPVLVLSTHDETLYAERVLRAGAKGYVMKRESMTKLLEAIRKVAHGGLYFSEATTARMLNRFSGSRDEQQALPVDRLSDRELVVLEFIGRGRRTREIAQDLHISIKTVQAHREHIKQKLLLRDALSLTRYAVKWVEFGGGSAAPAGG